jgi:hypothetical protein
MERQSPVSGGEAECGSNRKKVQLETVKSFLPAFLLGENIMLNISRQSISFSTGGLTKKDKYHRKDIQRNFTFLFLMFLQSGNIVSTR